MEIFGYIKKSSDIVISFGCQHIGDKVYGYKKGKEGKVFLGNVKDNSKITMPLSIFNNFDGFKINDDKIEFMEEK